MHMYYNNHLIILYLTLAHNQKLHQIVVTTYDAKLLLNTDYQDDITSAKIKTALYDLNDEFGNTSINSLAMVIEPVNARCVRAARDMKPYELKLVPLTPNVIFTKKKLHHLSQASPFHRPVMGAQPICPTRFQRWPRMRQMNAPNRNMSSFSLFGSSKLNRSMRRAT